MKNIIFFDGNFFLKRLAENFNNYEEKSLNQVFIFPSKRAGMFFQFYLDKSKSQDVSIYSFEELIDNLACHNYGAGRAISFLDQVWELYQIVKENEINCKTVRCAQSFELFIPWGIEIVAAFEEIEREGITPPNYFTSTDIRHDELPLGLIWKKWHERIKQIGKSTLGMRYRTCIERWNNEELPSFLRDSHVNFVGFIKLRAAEKAFLRAISRKASKVTIWFESIPGETLPEDTKDFIKQCGFSFSKAINIDSEDNHNPKEQRPTVHLYESPDRHHALEKVKEIVNSIDNSAEYPSKTAIIIPDNNILIPLLYTLESNTPVNVAIGYPIGRSLVSSLALLWLEFIISRTDDNRFYVPALIHFLHHPYVSVVIDYELFTSESMSILTEMTEILREAGSSYMSCEEIESLLKEVNPRASDIFTVVKTTFIDSMLMPAQCFRDVFQNIANVVREIINASENISIEIEEDDRYLWSGRDNTELYLCKKFITDILEMVIESEWSSEPVQKIDTVYRFLKEVVNVIRVPFNGSPLHGIQILGLFESNLLSFENVIVLDANEGFLPSRRSPDRILPDTLRRQLGLPTSDTDVEFSRWVFMRLVKTARENAHIFYTALSSTQGSNYASSFGFVSVRSRFVEELIWEINKKTHSIEDPVVFLPVVIPHSVLRRQEYIDKTPYQRKIKEIIEEWWMSASLFNTYLKCPVMFYYRYVLGLEKSKTGIKDVFDDQGYAELGTILHNTLQMYFQSMINRDSNGTIDLSVAINLFNDLFSKSTLVKRLGYERKLFVYETAIYRLNQYLTWLKEKWGTFKVLSVEKDFYLTKLFSELAANFYGRIDMLALRNNNEVWIVDYKSGIPPSPKISWEMLADVLSRWSSIPMEAQIAEIKKGIKDLQLPFYAMLLSETNSVDFNIELTQIRACYHALGTGDSTRYQLEIKDNLLDTKDIFQKVIECIIRHIISSKQFYATDNASVCQRCDYTSICQCV